VDDWFSNYFLDAAEPMRQMFDEINVWYRYLEETYPVEVNGNIYNPINKAKY
jgi:hypothetical protein